MDEKNKSEFKFKKGNKMIKFYEEQINEFPPQREITDPLWGDVKNLLSKFKEDGNFQVTCIKSRYGQQTSFFIKAYNLPGRLEFIFEDVLIQRPDIFVKELVIRHVVYENLGENFWEIMTGASSSVRSLNLEECFKEFLLVMAKKKRKQMKEIKKDKDFLLEFSKRFSTNNNSTEVDYVPFF